MVQDARRSLWTALHLSWGRKHIAQTKRSCSDALPPSSPGGMKPDNRNRGVIWEAADDIYATFVR
jgi:hypothetical protein